MREKCISVDSLMKLLVNGKELLRREDKSKEREFFYLNFPYTIQP